MNPARFATHPLGRLVVLVVLLAAAWSSPGTAATGSRPKYVLLLHSFNRQFAPFDTFADVFSRELIRLSPDPIVFFDAALHPDPNLMSPDGRATVNYLHAAFAGRQLDLVVTIGGPAAAFAQKYRGELFPKTPLVYGAVDRRFVESGTLTARDTAVATSNDPSRIIDNVLRVVPDAANVFVVIGNSPLERFWKADLAREFQPFVHRLTFAWGDSYSYDELRQHAATLPPHSVILYILYAVDASDSAFTEEQVLSDLRNTANAPIFGLQSPQLGRGIVGGPLMPIEDLGRTTSGIALRILGGESPAAIRLPPQTPGAPVFDWRELRRWNIDERRLPSGSTVRFRGVTVWQRYRSLILGSGAFLLTQTALIIALVGTRLKRRRAELAVRESEARFRVLADSAPVMIWIAGTDMLCTDFNRSWLEFTGRSLEAERGNGWTQGVHPADVERCMTTYVNAFRKREAFEMDYRLRHADGDYRWVLDCGVPRFTDDGTFAGYIGSAIDITDQKLARSALATLSNRLMDAHETERARIARELHDDLGQRVAGLTMMLYSLVDDLRADSAQTRIEFLQLCNQFTELSRDVSAISHRLHPSLLDLRGLAPAAASLCKETSEQYKVCVNFKDEDVPPRLPREITLGLFRVLQEALTNAVKHSGSRQIGVTLRGGSSDLRLEVVDHGVGFNSTASVSTNGLGLMTMRERLILMNGELTIDSRPGVGTRLIAVVQIASEGASAAATPSTSAIGQFARS